MLFFKKKSFLSISAWEGCTKSRHFCYISIYVDNISQPLNVYLKYTRLLIPNVIILCFTLLQLKSSVKPGNITGAKKNRFELVEL